MQQCDFCLNNRSVTKAENSAVAEQGVYQGWLKGSSKFLIIDEQGRRMGQVGDKYIREIPGAKFYWLKNGQYVLDEKTKPVFRFPVVRSFEITMNGSSLQETDSSEVSVIGPGYFFSVENLWTKAKNQDRIEIAADGSEYRLSYMMDSGGSPVIMFGLETTLAD